MMVELDAAPGTTGVTFSRKSATRNMDFVKASSFNRDATIGTKGYGPAPAGKSAHELILQVTTREVNAGRTVTKTDEPGSRISRLTWICEGYLGTGNFIIIHGKRYELYDPVGSFGYVVSHEGPVARWEWDLRGAQKIGENRYRIAIPPGRSAKISTHIAPVEYNWSLSLHAGGGFPLGGFATDFMPGVSTLLDFAVPLRSWLVLEAVAGYYDFPSRTQGLADARWIDLSANVRGYITIVDPVSLYLGGGGGAYIPVGGALRAGANAGAGFAYRLNSLLSLEAGADYRLVFGSWQQLVSVTAGVVVRF
jgi:hypothetical protein